MYPRTYGEAQSFLWGFEKRGRILSWRIFLCGIPVPPHIYEDLLKYKRGAEIRIGTWTFSIPYGMLYLDEKHCWGRDYTPPGGLQGRTVLDVGAGDGETAKWFIDRGASQVLAVEKSPDRLRYLRRNAENNSGLKVINGSFNPEVHLQIPVDLVKIDIEGYEILFAEYLESHPEFNVDVVLEAHSVYLINRFKSLGFSEYPPPLDLPYGRMIGNMYRWKK